MKKINIIEHKVSRGKKQPLEKNIVFQMQNGESASLDYFNKQFSQLIIPKTELNYYFRKLKTKKNVPRFAQKESHNYSNEILLASIKFHPIF